jgi:ABC-type cobalamin/Fe3+-siderophores transport system ATPase subunit
MDRGRLVADAPPAQALGPERVAEVFGVATLSVEADGGRLTIPWRPL